jgi:hypothetical protein
MDVVGFIPQPLQHRTDDEIVVEEMQIGPAKG